MKRNALQCLRLRQGVSAASSCSCSSLSERLNRELTTRKLPLFYDYLHPQPSHLLNVTLTDLFPDQQPLALERRTLLPSIETTLHMAPGHHLVYFPPQVTLSQLLPDGTDILHSPGDPFNRRLWAGGKVRFPTLDGPLLDGSRAVCLETIRDVTVKGPKGEEKIVVSIERRVGVVEEQEEEHEIREKIWTENEEENGQASIIETRNLIFMREKTQEQLENDKKNFEENNRNIKCALRFNSCYGNRMILTLSCFRPKRPQMPNFVTK